MRRALRIAPVLEAAADDGADLAHQGQVGRQRLVEALEHRHALATLQHLPEQIRRERPEHHQVDDANLDAAGLAQVVGDGFGRGHDTPLAEDQVVGVVGAVAHDPGVGPAGESVELAERPVGEPLDVVEEEGALRGDALHVSVLVLDQAGHHRVVDVPEQRDPPPGVAVEDALRRHRHLDDILGEPEILANQLALGDVERLDEVGRQEAVLGDDAGIEGELGNAVGDDVQVGRRLHVLGEKLEEAGVVDAVIVVVAGVHVQGRLGHRPRPDVEDVGQALADRRVQRLVHVRDPLAGGEIGRSQPGHREAGGHRRGGVLALRLDEDQRPAGDVDVSGGRRFRPVFAHLGRRGDRVGAGGVTRVALALDDRRVAVHRRARSRILPLAAHFDGACPCVQRLFDRRHRSSRRKRSPRSARGRWRAALRPNAVSVTSRRFSYPAHTGGR